MNALMISNCMFNKDVFNGVSNNKVNGDIKTPYLLDTIKLCANEEFHLVKVLASPISSGDRKNKYNNGHTPNNKVTPSSHDPSKNNDNPGIGDKCKWKMDPQLIISAVTSNTQNGNITKSRANIYTIGPHGYRCSEYHAGLNEVLEMTKSVNLNTVSLCSTDFSFLMNTNIYIRSIDTSELSLTCFSSHPEPYSIPIRSVLPETYMTASHEKLEGNKGWSLVMG